VQIRPSGTYAIFLGLFLSIGSSVATAGPAGALLAYAVVGVFVYGVVMPLGEMSSLIPVRFDILFYFSVVASVFVYWPHSGQRGIRVRSMFSALNDSSISRQIGPLGTASSPQSLVRH
jgi:hypothetical protein